MVGNKDSITSLCIINDSMKCESLSLGQEGLSTGISENVWHSLLEDSSFLMDIAIMQR